MRRSVYTCALFSLFLGCLIGLAGCSSESSSPASNSAPLSDVYTAPMHDTSESMPDSAPAGEMAHGEAASEIYTDPAPTAPATEPKETSTTLKKQEIAHREREEKRRQEEIQSGLLTAGSFDDVLNFESYQEFLNKVLQADTHERFPRWAVGKCISLTVLAKDGKPVGNAKVEIRAVPENQQQQPLITSIITGTDGRAVLLTGEDKLSEHQQVSLRILAAGSEPLETVADLSQPEWKFTLEEAQSQLPDQLDLALVIDTTGSMGDELEYLKAEIDDIATTIEQMFPQVDQRFALVVYRDQGDSYVTRTFDFTSSLADFRSTLSSQSAGGGGDYPEAMHLAVEHAGELDWRGGNTARVMFLVGDAPPHKNYARRTLEAGLKLRERGVRVYPLGASGVAAEAEFIMRAMAFASVGQYLFLTDHSGIGNAHATPHVTEFQVERLDRLMIRMIAGELAGKRLAPEEVIAIERGNLNSEEGVPPEPVEQIQTSECIPVQRPYNATKLAESRYVIPNNLIAWALFASLIMSIFCFDMWEKYRRNRTIQG